jgi:ABC-type sugar transport system permease subunit
MPIDRFLNTRSGRIVLENLTAYLFIFPAGFIIFTFGLFPVAFAFFVSLYRWRRFPETYQGLDNYVDALGNLGFVLFFWLAVILFLYSLYLAYHLWQATRYDRRTSWLVIPGIVNAAAFSLFILWFFRLLPVILEIPRRLPRDRARDRGLFIDEFFNSFSFPEVSDVAQWMLPLIVLALILVAVALRYKASFDVLMRFSSVFIGGIASILLMRLTLAEINTAIQSARDAGEDLPIWSQIIFISIGIVLLVAAYGIWQYALRQTDDRRFFSLLLAAIVILAGGYLLVAEIPRALSEADDNLMQGFWVTVLYVIGTVPVQLGVGLALASLLFNLRIGKTFFRMLYFLPYITPFAATAVVFTTLFSNRLDSPANRFLDVFGIEGQKWLLEPTPINELIWGRDLPQILEGPGLALVVIILWSTWTYAGYDTVIFLAGLGNISPEYYEAAKIDGASSWALFRYITLPLLSPTTFFLSLVAIIGTFQAFTQIWIMRRPASDDAVDTVGVYLFDVINSQAQYGYGSAMAFVLFAVILLITLFQNRILGRRVFYG